MRLHQEPDGFSFTCNEEGQCPWRHFPIVENWRDPSSAETAYKSVLSHLGISWKHLVHMRSAGIEDASSWGNLSPDETSTMSKHWGKTTCRLRMSYISELQRGVIACLSGFGSEVRGDGTTDWFVAECYLDVEAEFPGFVEQMYPCLQQWIEDAEEPSGDKTDCAHNFLHHLLPHLALRLAQRGTYFIKWAPKHPLAKALLSVMGPRYEKWAAMKRKECDANMAQHMMELGLKNNLGGTLYDMASRLDRIEKQRKRDRKQSSKMYKLMKTVASQNAELLKRSGGSTGVAGSFLSSSLARLRAQRVPRAEDSGSNGVSSSSSGDSSSDSSSSSEDGAERPMAAPVVAPAQGPAAARPLGLGRVLRATAVQPILSTKFPSSVVQLLNEHNRMGLNKLRLADKQHWDGSVRTRYSRRQGVFEAIERKAQIVRSPSDVAARMAKAAAEMDKERGTASMTASRCGAVKHVPT